MIIKTYKPCTPGLRMKTGINFTLLTSVKANKKLTKGNQRAKGRNNQGKITTRHKGGGHKRLYRQIDFKRNKYNTIGIVSTIEYDPNRSANIALISYKDGEKKYILHPETLKIGDEILAGENVPIKVGNSLPLYAIPLGTHVHNIELVPKKGAQLIRAAGASAKIVAKEDKFVSLLLASKEIRLIRKECYATIGKLGNFDRYNVNLGKAGRSRWLGIRPSVRGSAMNAVDHPHGGGEGRSPIGRPRPLTPWGKPTLGFKTRKKRKKSDSFIIRR